MTKALVLISCLFFGLISNAQVSQFSSLSPGNVSATVPNNIKNLKLSGSIDARDFKFMRDQMNLDTLDLSDVNIVGYSGVEGTEGNASYPANEIPSTAFINKAIRKIYFPTNLKNIGEAAFSSCANLTDLNFPATLDSIKMHAFVECYSLTSLSFPSSMTHIGDFAFATCTGITGTVNLPNIDDFLHDAIFTGCTGIRAVVIPSTIHIIGEYVFYGCTSLESVSLVGSIREIQSSAFLNCSSLNTIGSLNSVNIIRDSAFKNCTSLTNLSMTSIQEIQSEAFSGCTSLRSLALGTNIATINSLAFNNCNSLNNITITKTIPPTTAADAFNQVNTAACVVKLPNMSYYNVFHTNQAWAAFNYTTLGAPQSTSPSSISATGFTANWNAVDGATGYKLDVSTSATFDSTIGGYSNLTVNGTTLNISGLSSNSYYYYRVRAVDATTFSANSNTQRVIYNYLTSELGSGNWDATTEWHDGIIPPADSKIVVRNNLTLTSHTTINSLTINTGATLQVNPAIQLTINSVLTNNGSLSLLSDASGTATILTPTSISGSGSYTINQFLTTGRNWYLSSPVTSATRQVITNATNVYWFDHSVGQNGDWATLANDDILSPLKGYVARVASEATIAFTGTPNNGTVQLSDLGSVAGGNYQGFHLLGNPYPSYLNWSMATKTNLESNIWYRTRNASNSYIFDTFNTANGQGTSNNNNSDIQVTGYIAPMQAFWVRVNTNTVGAVELNNTMRLHQDQRIATNRLKAPAISLQKVLRLKVSNGINSDETILLFNENASNEYDVYDSPKMSNNNTAIPELYTEVGSEKLTINGMSLTSGYREIPLGFKTGSANSFYIKAISLSNFTNDEEVILKDYQLNTEQVLTTGSVCNFTSEIYNGTSRFSLIFRSTSQVTNTEKPVENSVQVYVNSDKNIVVQRSTATKANLSIYNTSGQKIMETYSSEMKFTIQKQLSAGSYILVINDDKMRGIKLTVN